MSKPKAKPEVKQASGRRKHRENLFIIADMLEAARTKALKPQIMNKAKVTHRQFNVYLRLLLKAKLLEATTRNEKTFYKTTHKGEGYLKDFANLLKRLGIQS